MNWDPVTARFDELVHSPTRLRITAALAAGTAVEFSALQDALTLSASLLSKQLRMLGDAGYVAVEKRRQPLGRPRTWIRLTSKGRRAYLGHVEALRQLVGLPDADAVPHAGRTHPSTDSGRGAPSAPSGRMSG